jgi:hypothetical protein
LPFLDLVDELDIREGNGGVSKALKSEHGSHSLFDSPLILFNQVV